MEKEIKKTRIVHCKREKFDVLIDRTTKWGNPFKIGQRYKGEVLTRATCLLAYEDWIRYSDQGIKLQEDLHELVGKVLGCWCKPLPCHGDILILLIKERYNER